MNSVSLTIDGKKIEAEAGTSLLLAAQQAGIYIPTLCYHPDLPSFSDSGPARYIYRGSLKLEATSDEAYQGCGLCLVEIGGGSIQTACNTPVSDGLIVQTDTSGVHELRNRNLAAILANHPHECLFCPQREGCDLQQCSMNVPKEERCCHKFNDCELRRVVEYIGHKPDIARCMPGESLVAEDEPLFKRDYHLCINCTRCVRICTNLFGAGALGYVSIDGKVSVGMLGPSAIESGCKFCGACVEVCPTGAFGDKDIKLAGQEAALVPCRNACPAGIDVPRYVSLIAQGKFAEAASTVREKVPFPMVLGRVCFHPCEDVCRRGAVNDSICINMLKRFAAQYHAGLFDEKSQVTTGAEGKVAIIGSGPAGLTAGYYLARLGRSVTVFETLPEPGGMLRTGIPEYRLPREVLDKEIESIKNTGVEIKINTRVESLDELASQDYQAVFIAIGAHLGISLGIEGEDNIGVVEGIAMLRKLNLGQEVKLGKRIAVIGGGNVAIDSGRASLRLGAEEVVILYRRSRDEMPANREEIEQAINEGVKIDFLVIPEKITRKNDILNLTCLRTELGVTDASGRRSFNAIKGSDFVQEFDNVIIAIGQAPEIPERFDLPVTAGGNLHVKRETLMTSRNGIFAGGDVVSGPASVVEAIAMGKKAAVSIDRFLGGEGKIDEEPVELNKPDFWLGRDESFASRQKVMVPVLSVQERKHEFKEVSLGYKPEQATEEASRCLRCDLRLGISAPVPPPKKWLDFNADNLENVPQLEGVFQLLDMDSNVIYIKGSMNMKNELREQLDSGVDARYFIYEEARMYTQRESELLQEFLQKHGSLPLINIGGDLDDLL